MFKYAVLLLILCANGARAVSCISGCGDLQNYITKHISSSENVVGATIDSSPIVIPEKRLQHNAGTEMQWISYLGQPVVAPDTSQYDWTFVRIDDYISLALKQGGRYTPSNTRIVSEGTRELRVFKEGEETRNLSSELQVRLRVDKKIVSGTYIKRILLAELGRCQPLGCSSKDVILQRIYVDVNITVPQTCTLNAGQIVNVDFGNISSAAFKTAGAKPEGVNPITRDITVNCDNITSSTAMEMRLQADKVSGNAVVSDNNDVGFVVADSNGNALTPNNLSSVISFMLNSTSGANVTIRIYPVSVTGNKPSEGTVTSQAYLRIDFA